VSALLLDFCLNAPSEIAALDDKGRSSFQLLQIFKSSGGVPLVYYVFDLLFLAGKDLREQPLTSRRKLLANLLKKAPDSRFLSNAGQSPGRALNAAQ
jgi:bifunctional non-homologous end joining protein LigD